jgi:hypothetical protein
MTWRPGQKKPLQPATNKAAARMLEAEIAHRWRCSRQQSRAANRISEPLAMASDLSLMRAGGCWS